VIFWRKNTKGYSGSRKRRNIKDWIRNQKEEKMEKNRKGLTEGAMARQQQMEKRLLETEVHSGKTAREIAEALTRDAEMVFIEGFVKGFASYYRDHRSKAPREMIRVNPDGSEDLIAYHESSREDVWIRRLAEPGYSKMAYLFLDSRYKVFKKHWENGRQ
jgi:hypothetical protein